MNRSGAPARFGGAARLGVTALIALCSCATREGSPGEEPGDSGRDEAIDAVCNGLIGFTEPLAPCSPEDPCEATSDGTVVSTPAVTVSCQTTSGTHPEHDDGPPTALVDEDGVERAWCRFVPDGEGPWPLVLWFHGAGGDAADVYDHTLLREKAESWEFAGGSGLVLVSVQGRNLHWPTADPRDGSHFDIYHRDLGSPSSNPDVALVDGIVDDLVEEGLADPSRIYAMGWSNGGFFAQLYAMARHDTATQGGNTVAAAAVFSAADPFHDAIAGAEPSCRLDPYPTSEVPLLVVGRACDLVPCDEQQAEGLVEEGYVVPPGAVVSTWMDDLASRVGDPNVERLTVDFGGEEVSECTAAAWCGLTAAGINHVLWPDGVSDGSGNDHEVRMLEFLEGVGR